MWKGNGHYPLELIANVVANRQFDLFDRKIRLIKAILLAARRIVFITFYRVTEL